MLFTVIKKNTYQDSINLMLLTNRINTLGGVKQSSIMMGKMCIRDRPEPRRSPPSIHT